VKRVVQTDHAKDKGTSSKESVRLEVRFLRLLKAANAETGN
jgi:hypothetical protein